MIYTAKGLEDMAALRTGGRLRREGWLRREWPAAPGVAGCAGRRPFRAKRGVPAKSARPAPWAPPSSAKRGPFYFGRPKSTLGATLAVSGAWKSGYSSKLKIDAVMFAGNERRDVLYCWTRSL
jgi:hypothetical protein